MKLSQFDYVLPEELIAQKPVEPRDHSRLLVLDKKNGEIVHDNFYNLKKYLLPSDILVVNNSKVFPARLIGQKPTGGKVEIFLNHQNGDGSWQALGKNIGRANKITFQNSNLIAEVVGREEQLFLVRFNLDGVKFFEELEKVGHTPLPPYIKRFDNKDDKNRYQTVYSKDKGSAAAPTAGLHFSDKLITDIKKDGIEIFELTLHVGLGTFAPVKTENIEEHKIHSEYYSIQSETFEKIKQSKEAGRRIIAVGTTTTRVLEHLFSNNTPELSGWTDIFIFPGYKFKCVDGLVTNFHLPKSSLLMLVSALAGKEKIDSAYREAVNKKYRFFSYGDAMFIN